MEEIYLIDSARFDLEASFFAGQCFRWKKVGDTAYEGVVKGRLLQVYERDGGVYLQGVPKGEFYPFYAHYFDLDTDYDAVKATLVKSKVMARAVAYCPGMRLFHQEFWETLCTFIISQNNNIPRITSIVEKLCALFGQEVAPGHFSFPSAQVVAALQLEDLAPLKAGFRGKYILDAAQKVAAGTVCAQTCRRLALEEAVEHLCQIKGVGVKVAQCTLLYGAEHPTAFPEDVWMKRVVTRYFKGRLPKAVLAHPGIAQLFLFYYIRNKEISENG